VSASRCSWRNRCFPQLVVDLEDCFHEEQVTALEQATGVLLVSRLDFTSLRNARRALDHFTKLGVARTRVKVIVSKSGQPSELPIEEAEDALGEKLSRFVPYDPATVNAANNSGVPAVIKNPKSKMAHAIRELSKINFEATTSTSGLLPTLKQLWKAIG
jgi:pilus assembly protein CpaE